MKSYLKNYIKLLATTAPVFIALGVLLLSKGPISSYVLSLSFFIAGLTGLIIIIRREIPMVIYSIKGSQAIIEGSLFILICWGGAIYIFINGL